MKIACTIAPGRGDTDLVLYSAAQRLQAQGYQVRGTVQINTRKEECCPCDMDIKVLPDGPLLRISQNLGQGSRGCRLDPDVLEQAVVMVGNSLQARADCLIINKFGKQEAEGHGFRDVIANALGLGIPVLVGLNQLNQDAFDEFSGGLAEILPPDTGKLEQWLMANVEKPQPAV